MRFRSLESQIVVLFLLLILAVQIASFIAIRAGITDNARAAVREELVISERVFRRLLDQNAQNLTTAARVLALDYGFRQAIGTNDKETIASVLVNHGARIGATLTMLVGNDRQIISATSIDPGASLKGSIMQLVDVAERAGSGNGIRLVDKHPYQLVVVPVKAPLTIGWVAMAFPIGKTLVADMRELSSLQVTILTNTDADHWNVEASTYNRDDALQIAAQLHEIPRQPAALPTMALGANDVSSRSIILADDGVHIAIAVLQRSLSEAIAPYQRLQLSLLLLTAIATLIAALGSVLTARRITGPLRGLTDTAKQLGQGDYTGHLEIKREDEIGELSRAFESMRDGISQRELEIRRLAYWDTLTDLPNRAQFVNQLTTAIQQAKRSGVSCQILMMDLDRFKTVNDVLGHTFGDALLREVATRLKHQLSGSENSVARLGGDEFAVLLPNADVRAAQDVARHFLKLMELPISLEDQNVDLGAGIGIAGYPMHGSDAESVLSRAELAMYASKRGSSGAVVYDPSIDRSSEQSLSLLSELRRAVDRKEFRLQVQPKIHLGSGHVVGIEALIRWVHPERGLIYPDEFIPFAEKTGFIRVITLWVLEESAALCSTWIAQGVFLKVSVNLSARDLLDLELPAKVAEIMLRHRVTPASFCLEITESTIMEDPVRALHTLERLNTMGFELAIDDFGTGYSSLAYLKRLPVDELKIDKSFVMNMALDANDAQIVRSTIDLGHNMGLRVVAEGIESEIVWNLLTAMGCDQGQGFFISRPIASEDLAGWIDQWVAPASRLSELVSTDQDV